MTYVFAIALIFAIAPTQQPADQVRAFLENAYTVEARHQAADFRIFLTPSLEALVLRDRRAAGKGFVGKLDFDPICDCQDFEDATTRISQIQVTGHSGSAHILLIFPDRSRKELDLDLALSQDHWLIEDVHTKQTPSLRRFLSQ